MIRVNLLPQELRRAESTPLKQFFATMGAVVVVALSVVSWLFVHLGKLGPREQDLRTIEEEVKTQAAKVAESKNLAGWLQDYKTQYEKIDKVASTRVLWSRKIDECWEVVVNPNPAGKYDVWLKSLAGKVSDSAKTGGEVTFSGASAGPQVYKLSDFHEAVTSSDFFKDFGAITYPAGTREPLGGADREPKEGWTFQMNLQLRNLKELNDARLKAAGGGAGAKK
jgi:Tfp pilus assembly protein PilN